MSYTIGSLIYGIPITEALSKKARDLAVDLEEVGFTEEYSAGGCEVGYLGVEVLEFDECTDVFRFSEMENAKSNLSVDEKLKVAVDVTMFQMEYPELAKILVDDGIEMDYYIVWSSS
jgi:hypothetical protein